MAHYEFNKQTYYAVTLRINRNTDPDIIDHLKAQESVNGYLLTLIRDAMTRKENVYELIETVQTSTDLARISGFSVGSYRQSDGYQRRMRKRFPELAVLQYPYETVNGYCQYDSVRREEIEQFVYSQLAQYTDPDRIFRL